METSKQAAIWKLDPRNGHCATPSQCSRRKSREISGIVTENTVLDLKFVIYVKLWV